MFRYMNNQTGFWCVFSLWKTKPVIRSYMFLRKMCSRKETFYPQLFLCMYRGCVFVYVCTHTSLYTRGYERLVLLFLLQKPGKKSQNNLCCLQGVWLIRFTCTHLWARYWSNSTIEVQHNIVIIPSLYFCAPKIMAARWVCTTLDGFIHLLGPWCSLTCSMSL